MSDFGQETAGYLADQFRRVSTGTLIVSMCLALAACAGNSDAWWDSQYDYRQGSNVSSSSRDPEAPRPRVRPARQQASNDNSNVRPIARPVRNANRTPRTAPSSARVHVVQRGDTVYSISTQYRVQQQALKDQNNINDNNALYIGQRLTIPGAGTPTATPAPRVAASTPGAQTPRARPQVGLPPPATGQFIWPAEGRIVSRFGPKEGGLHNDGINIAVPEGTAVKVAQSGVVAYAGNELRGYGNLLLVRHENGWMTAYAHNGELLVNRGDMVTKGQVIARSGSSGSVSTPQIHFEIRRGSSAVDPLTVMSG